MVGGTQPGRPLLLASGTNCSPNCSFRRLRKLHGDEVPFWIKVVLAGLIDHANLMKLCRSLIGNCQVELPQLKGSGIALVFHTDDKSRLSSLHWIPNESQGKPPVQKSGNISRALGHGPQSQWAGTWRDR